jgi:dihydropteroate synthase
MNARIIEISDAEKEMLSIGVDRMGIKLMAPKAVLRAIKLKGIRPTAANIIKQDMLSLGGEAATSAGTIDHSVKETDVLLFGTLKQLGQLAKKLRMHQFSLLKISKEIETALKNYDSIPKSMKIGPRTLDFGRRTYIMGILNVTPDSFSDGGKFYRVDDAIAQAEKMLEDGADIVDVGGESTRPGARAVTAEEEIKRVMPVIRALSRIKGAAISIDTRRARVARAALDAGADMINDVSGLRYDKKMAAVAGRSKTPVCVMHMQGMPQNMQKNPAYKDLMGEIISYLEESIAIAKNAGILHEKILVDPGIGFGKTLEHNLEILKRLRELKVLGQPILVGPSRKSMIGKVLGLPVEERVEGTVAAAAIAIANGADIVRVHDVKEIKRVVRMTDAIVRTSTGPVQRRS